MRNLVHERARNFIKSMKRQPLEKWLSFFRPDCTEEACMKQIFRSLVEGRKSMEKQKVRDEIAARFGKKNWLVKVLPVAYCLTGVLLMTAVPVYADDIFATAKNAMQTVYTDVAGIATVAAVVCAAVCLFLMNFSKSGRTVDESRSWLKRIVICWAALMTLGAIVTYLEKIIPQSMFTG